MAANNDFFPYKGLEPFSEADAEYFFGREYDSEIIANHLISSPLTILYGGSGVGKTSVLLAGVIPFMRHWDEVKIVVFRSWQHRGFLQSLKTEIAGLAGDGTPGEQAPPGEQRVAELCAGISDTSNKQVVIVLDQFEEYFLYNPDNNPHTEFEAELAATVNRSDSNANILLSLRDDSLSLLNRFKRRIPNLFNTQVRLDRLDRRSAERAIRMPLERYNQRYREGRSALTIDDELVQQLLTDCVPAREFFHLAAAGDSPDSDDRAEADTRIETPILQLALERVWKSGVTGDRPALRYATLVELGGVETIVKTHLDGVLQGLSRTEMEVCSRLFDRLVTPGGRKIAYSEKELKEFSGKLEQHVDSVLEYLAAPDRRILRRIMPPVDAQAPASADVPALYEMFHDVLALAAVDWRNRYEQTQENTKVRRRFARRLIGGLAAAAVALIALSASHELWQAERPWGYVRELSTGAVYELRDEAVTLGRGFATGTSQRQVSIKLDLSPLTISRLHVMLFRNNSAIDLRSANGTTVNSEFLPYGQDRFLAEGDIIVLAGMVALAFQPIEYLPFQFWTPSIDPTDPPPGWGMFVDGTARTAEFLTGNIYYLSRSPDGGYVASESKTGQPLMVIRLDPDGLVSLEDVDDEMPLIMEAKENDYDYFAYEVTAGIEFEYVSTGRESHDLFEVVFRYGDAPFQIVPTAQTIEKYGMGMVSPGTGLNE